MKKRESYLDYARVFAIISISCNHAITRAFSVYDTTYEEFLAYPKIVSLFRSIIYVFSRMGVPVFLMITGALLLNKKIETKEDVLRFTNTISAA